MRMVNEAEFEDYDETSKAYDNTRIPAGIEIIMGYLCSNETPLNEQTILDAGCGTGNFIEPLVGRVSKINGIEYNAGMFKQVRSKFKDDPTVQIDRGNILELPYDDETFDGIMCNHVIHHLDDGRGGKNPENYPNLQKFLTEAYRVLRLNGGLLINTCSHKQQRKGYWWADLIPKAVDKVTKKFPPIRVIEQMMREIGFTNIDFIVPFNVVLQGSSYLDPEGPLKDDWRAGDSTWALATDFELREARFKVKNMNKDGTMSAYLKLREAIRKKTGQTTLIYGKKT